MKIATDPPVSEKQRRAMWAAAKGQSTLGIPQNVGKEFVGKDADPNAKASAAGVIVMSPDGRALFLKRGPDGDHPGTWCWPAGGRDGDEAPPQTAARELAEETGFDIDPDELLGVERRTSDEGVDFTTFVHHLDKPSMLAPHADEEHVGYAWAPLHDPPSELHPDVAATLDRLALRADRIQKYRAAGASDSMAMDWVGKVDDLERCGVMDVYRGAKKTTALRHGLAFDRSSVRTYTVDGRLDIEKANISKATINPYVGREIPDYEKLGLEPDKIYKLYRDPAELQKAAPTFNKLPLLIDHVPVTADDHQPDLVVGATGTDAAFEMPFLTNGLVVWAKEGIDGIESDEKKELSAAYRYRADMTPGEVNGERYDGVMRDIVGNHVALVKEGRAGSDVVVGDSKETIEMKTTLIAALTLGHLTAAIGPKLAQDQKVDLKSTVADLTTKNFKERKPKIMEELKKLTTGKLAKDANLEDVTKLLDSLEKVEGADAEVPAGLEPNSSAMAPAIPEKKDPEAMDTSWARDWLAGKGVGEDDISEFEKMMSEKSKPAADEDEEAKKKREAEEAAAAAKDADLENKDKDMVDKKAMDAALKRVSEETEKSVIAKQKALREAEKDVRDWVGDLAVAQDSAEGVYAAALATLGVKDVDGLPVKALQHILHAQPKPGESKGAKKTVAMDAAGVEDFAKRFPGTDRVQLAS